MATILALWPSPWWLLILCVLGGLGVIALVICAGINDRRNGITDDDSQATFHGGHS